jgi:uncharacterized protein (TIRG00374 family)
VSTANHKPAKSKWQKLSFWFVGALILSGLILLVTHFSELEHFVKLIRQADPRWLILAIVLQFSTYICVAAVWFIALRSAGHPHSFMSLIPLGVAKLFSDQAMPSGGMSGTAFFISALNHRGIPTSICMATLLLSLVSYYGAYLIAALVTILLLWFYHAINIWIVFVVIVFCLIAVGTPAGAFWLRSLGKSELPKLLQRIPGLSTLMNAFSNAPQELLRKSSLIIKATFLHGSVFVLDAITLWVMLQVVGVHASFWITFPSFVLASMVATIGPVPLGLGTFEASCVGMLNVLGIPVEAALTATLLLRGFTLWLPMLPGMWLAKRALQ